MARWASGAPALEETAGEQLPAASASSHLQGLKVYT